MKRNLDPKTVVVNADYFNEIYRVYFNFVDECVVETSTEVIDKHLKKFNPHMRDAKRNQNRLNEHRNVKEIVKILRGRLVVVGQPFIRLSRSKMAYLEDVGVGSSSIMKVVGRSGYNIVLRNCYNEKIEVSLPFIYILPFSVITDDELKRLTELGVQRSQAMFDFNGNIVTDQTK